MNKVALVVSPVITQISGAHHINGINVLSSFCLMLRIQISCGYVHFCLCSESIYDLEFNHLMRGMEGLLTEKPPQVEGLTVQQRDSMMHLARLPQFKNITRYVQTNPVSIYDLVSEIT